MSPPRVTDAASPEPVVRIEHLDFRYSPDGPVVLRDVELTVHAGERWLLVGANGAGKSTLLRLLAGQHLVPPEQVRVLGRPAFDDCSLVNRVRFIGGPLLTTVDITVAEMLAARPPADPARRAHLLHLLDIDPDWHMDRVSDGQRRRVHVLLHIDEPKGLLLLDEVTTDLDVVVRADLLALLAADAREHGTAMIYATHIFDGLDDWATHIALLERGRLVLAAELGAVEDLRELHARGVASPLYRVVERWIRSGYAGGR
jgi:CCR4-NOT complex subunit CAF16